MAMFPRFSMLSEVFKDHLQTQMHVQIFGKILKRRRSLLLAFKNLKSEKKNKARGLILLREINYF